MRLSDLAAATLLCGLLAASLSVWMVILGRVSRGQPIVTPLPRRTVPWGALDLLLVMLLYFLLQGGGMIAAWALAGVDPKQAAADLAPEQAAARLISTLAANGIASVLATSIAVLLLWKLCGATAEDFGVRPRRPGSDIALGLVTFLAALAPVYAIQLLLTRFFPSEHPVVTMLTKQAHPGTLLVAFFTAVLVAPIAEEFFFRVLLQGWLERVETWWRAGGQGLDARTTDLEGDAATGPASARASGDLRHPAIPLSEASAATSLRPDDDNPYRAPLEAGRPSVPAASRRPEDMATPRGAPGTAPILISSAAFAAMHIGHGPDPIPLFVLALMLGYLYHRTHRLLPCVVLHMAINAFSLLVLWLTITFGQAK
jgi:membrane protease YdiL (CAAX protease family)